MNLYEGLFSNSSEIPKQFEDDVMNARKYPSFMNSTLMPNELNQIMNFSTNYLE
jgi:hypothetical protein